MATGPSAHREAVIGNLAGERVTAAEIFLTCPPQWSRVHDESLRVWVG